MYCTNCGIKLDDNAVFCSNCGHKIGRQEFHTGNFADDINNGFNNVMAKPKSKLLAAILALLFGSMGIHDFYLGYNKKGVTHLLMFVFFLGTVSWLWALWEALMIFTGRIATDANGKPLTD